MFKISVDILLKFYTCQLRIKVLILNNKNTFPNFISGVLADMSLDIFTIR